MKLAISGKGGVGKTTLAVLLARMLALRGKRVLLIDADPLPNAAAMLGISANNLIPLAERTEFIAERTGVMPGKSYGQMFILNPKVDDIVERFAVRGADGVQLLVLGTIKSGGSGCYCPQSALVRHLLRHLILEREEFVLMDMEAGIEHLGRSSAAGVELMLVVVEPSLRSVATAARIKKLALDIGIQHIFGVLNKVRDCEEERLLVDAMNAEGMQVFVRIPYSESLAEAGLKEGPIELCKIPEIECAITALMAKIDMIARHSG